MPVGQSQRRDAARRCVAGRADWPAEHRGLATAHAVRPGTEEVFGQLVASGHDVYVWSGMGVRWDEVRRSGLEPFVKGVYRKPLTDFRAGLDLCGVPDFVIDDYPQVAAHRVPAPDSSLAEG